MWRHLQRNGEEIQRKMATLNVKIEELLKLTYGNKNRQRIQRIEKDG